MSKIPEDHYLTFIKTEKAPHHLKIVKPGQDRFKHDKFLNMLSLIKGTKKKRQIKREGKI